MDDRELLAGRLASLTDAQAAELSAMVDELGEEDLLGAWSPMLPWSPPGREVHVYFLEVRYPEAAFESGFRPYGWPQAGLPWRERWSLLRRGFRWPRVRMYLSASGAYRRAALLEMYGAKVTVHRSHMVLWPAPAPGESDVEFDLTGLPLSRG